MARRMSTGVIDENLARYTCCSPARSPTNFFNNPTVFSITSKHIFSPYNAYACSLSELKRVHVTTSRSQSSHSTKYSHPLAYVVRIYAVTRDHSQPLMTSALELANADSTSISQRQQRRETPGRHSSLDVAHQSQRCRCVRSLTSL
jgi:hypothetical protein